MIDPNAAWSWSPWYPLDGCWRDARIPSKPGLYRIRRVGHQAIDYIGQTGAGNMTLRKRLAMLAGVYADEMPYRDPHTAAPALWALRHATGCTFEVSVMVVEGSTPYRKGLEALAISLYRQEHRRSPTINFGRMPSGYRMSSGNNQRLVLAGKRFRGGPVDVSDTSHLPSLPPRGALTTDVLESTWCGFAWSAWSSIDATLLSLPKDAIGLYRIRGGEHSALLYIGQGRIASRLRAHQAKQLDPDNIQGRIFAAAQRLECSTVRLPGLHGHQLLELENDLIAAYMLARGEPPAAQFLG